MNFTRLLLTFIGLTFAPSLSIPALGSLPEPITDARAGMTGYWRMTNVVSLSEGRAFAWVSASGNVDLSRTRTFDKVTLRSEYVDAVVSSSQGTLGLSVERGAPSQQWNLVPTSPDGRTVQIVNVANESCVEATPDEVLQLTPCKTPEGDWDSQRFWLIPAGRGRVQIAPLNYVNVRISANENFGLTMLPRDPENPLMNWILSRPSH